MTGRIKKPDTNSDSYEDWEEVDLMVQWILNSIEKHMSDNYLYCVTAKEMWDTLQRRYGGSNGVKLYDLEKEITNLVQGNLFVSEYFTKLQQLWDELQSLQPPPTCECEASKTLETYKNSKHIIRFLMGLNDSYDGVKNQILLIKPLPDIDTAYSMVLQCENKVRFSRAMKNPLTIML